MNEPTIEHKEKKDVFFISLQGLIKYVLCYYYLKKGEGESS